jgi:hypothetical protein
VLFQDALRHAQEEKKRVAEILARMNLHVLCFRTQREAAKRAAGLEYRRYGLWSGSTVAMISLPFSMGIAITSGAPPVCGITSAIMANSVLPFFGGSYVTISGPAAGLAPAWHAGMIMLGGALLGADAKKGDLLHSGYPFILVATWKLPLLSKNRAVPGQRLVISETELYNS